VAVPITAFSFCFRKPELCHRVRTRSGHTTQLTVMYVYVVQLYWGTKSELGQVVTQLSEVYESAKRDAVTRLQQIGMETVAVSNSVTGQLSDFSDDQFSQLIFHSSKLFHLTVVKHLTVPLIYCYTVTCDVCRLLFVPPSSDLLM